MKKIDGKAPAKGFIKRIGECLHLKPEMEACKHSNVVVDFIAPVTLEPIGGNCSKCGAKLKRGWVEI